MVRGADPDEWRNRVRTALVNRKIEALAQLACSPNIRSLPAETLSLLGGALDNLGAPEQAVTVLRQAQQKHPEDFQINFQLAWAQEHSRPPQLDEAIRFYTAARALRPRNVAVHFWLANALQGRGRLDEACAELHRAIDLQPDSAIAHNNLAWLLATSTESKLRNPEEAVSLARKATALAPKQGIYWNTLGVACYRAGNGTEAIAALNKSKNLLQSQFESFNTFFLAMAHWQLDEKEQARQWHEQAVQWMEKNKPDDEELKRFRAESEALLGIKKN